MSLPPVAYPRARFAQATELLSAVLQSTAPADRTMDAYFRAHRQMGSRDRAFAADCAYGCLRRLRSLAHIVGRTPREAATPAELTAAYLLLAKVWSAADLAAAGFEADAAVLAFRVAEFADASALPFAVRADLPDPLAALLLEQYGEPGAQALALALNQPATLDVRVNSLRATREQLQHRLREEGVELSVTPHSPVGLRRADRAALFRCASFKDGWFEVQDEGSQLLSFLVEPQPHDRVVDFCAGAGGKTLHLGELMEGKGTVYAMDVSARRLGELRPRLRRSGLQNVRIVPLRSERDARLKRLAGHLDRVMVDAPCSGLGTLRRNPDLKWRPLDLDALQQKQLRILASAARLVRRGGRLVYATCSILRRENQDVVDAFLAEHREFTRVNAGEVLARRGIAGLDTAGDHGDLTLLPHLHGTDGFYAAVLDRAAGGW